MAIPATSKIVTIRPIASIHMGYGEFGPRGAGRGSSLDLRIPRYSSKTFTGSGESQARQI